VSRLIETQREAISTFVDEIGIEIGVYGDWQLKADFRPVFAPVRDGFRAVAVEGATRPFVFGREVEERMFRRAVPQRDRPIVAAAGAALCLRNLHHTGVMGLKLVLDAEFGTTVSPATARAAARALAAETGRNGVNPPDVFVELSRLAETGDNAMRAAFEGLRANRIGIALREKGDGIAFTGLPQSSFPDLVAIDGGWFRQVARQQSTAQLFGALVRGYRLQGATVLVQGVTTGAELRVALESGANWLSGPLLAPCALAGAVFPEETLPVETLLDERRVIPLFR
jgi:EAL domain-containing protein (putative c-di-GMP-specific phosphodiesterase class I)